MAALQITDRPDAYSRPVTQFLLAQAGLLPTAAQQAPELDAPGRFRSAHAALPF